MSLQVVRVRVYFPFQLFDYTVPGGKNARSLLALSAFDSLKPNADNHLRRSMAESAVTIEMV